MSGLSIIPIQVAPLSLTHGQYFELTTTGIVFDPEIPLAEWRALGEWLKRVDRAVGFWIGDWLLMGERKSWGQMYTQAIDETGLDYQTLANYKYVAQNVRFSLRKENLSFYHHLAVAKLGPDGQKRWLDRAESKHWTVKELREQMGDPFVVQNSGEQEWFTPLEYIEAAKQVMGRIDIDPASCEKANSIVGAARYYSLSDNGLNYEWHGKVWMNPPYASELIDQFASKFAAHVKAGDIQEGIVLVNNSTETQWFAELIQRAAAVVFPIGRIKFIDQEGNASGAPLQGQACIYFGGRANRFMQVFGQFGWGARLVP